MDKSNGCSFSSVTSIAVFSSAIFVVTLILVRLLYVMYCSSRSLSKRVLKPASTLIILGSGGHTAEMLNLLAVLQKDRFKPRFYIAAATDNMSLQKAQLLENSLAAEILGIRWSSIFYVESIARVRRLSLSGLLLYKLRMVDQLFVQWPQLQRQYPRATYVGRLM
ncbi:UDP-N-acetylglucosamine transferase subunit ALG14 [Glycine soja]|nr:UDP-N-acetylglucosamine transferase subunit ALG14 [Glycine soja]